MSSQAREFPTFHRSMYNLFFFSLHRLLDICHGPRREREMSLYLVFEHVHQDLASYLEKCPEPGLGQDRIKVRQIENKRTFMRARRVRSRAEKRCIVPRKKDQLSQNEVKRVLFIFLVPWRKKPPLIIVVYIKGKKWPPTRSVVPFLSPEPQAHNSNREQLPPLQKVFFISPGQGKCNKGGGGGGGCPNYTAMLLFSLLTITLLCAPPFGAPTEHARAAVA